MQVQRSHKRFSLTTTNMSFTMITHNPSKFNWADDDEDDFDFEVWKATADVSAPTVESLPPLQLPANEIEPVFATTFSTSNEVAPWAVSGPNHVSTPDAHLETPDWRCEKPLLVWRAMQETPDAPAFPELSSWDNGVSSPGYRVQYSQHWKNWKVNAGVDCRFTALLRGSKLKEVEMTEEDELEILPGEVVDLAPDVLETTASLPLQLDCPSQVALDAQITATTDTTVDEGYHSDESRLPSPTESSFEKDFDASTCATCVGLETALDFTKHSRVNSMDALRSEIDGADRIEERLTAPSVVRTDEEDRPLKAAVVPGFVPFDLDNRLFNAMATGWYYLSDAPWTAAAVITSGIVLGGAMHVWRKR
jgi:hypothetical protein